MGRGRVGKGAQRRAHALSTKRHGGRRGCHFFETATLPRGHGARVQRVRLCPPYRALATRTSIKTSLEPEHEQHGLVALLLELRNELMLAARDRAQAREDRDVLLAVDLERHRRR